MAVYPRGGTYWFSFVFDGKRIQRSTKQGNRKAAVMIEAAYRTRLAKGEVGIDEEEQERKRKQRLLTVGALLDALEERYRLDDRASPQNLSAISIARRAFGAKATANLSTECIDDYIRRRLVQGAANATINRVTGIVARAYTLAKRQPPEIQHLSEENNARKGFFERAEFDAVASNLPPDLADFARFAYLTGWRKSEVSSLRWADLEGDSVHLRAEHSKNREARSVPIAGELVALLERRRKARTIETPQGDRLAEWIFHRDGRRILEFRKAWKTACKRAGCSRLFHDLRRSAVRDMIRSGVPQSVAMEISGHKTISMFKRYDIVDQRDKAAAFERVREYHESAAKKVVSMAGQ